MCKPNHAHTDKGKGDPHEVAVLPVTPKIETKGSKSKGAQSSQKKIASSLEVSEPLSLAQAKLPKAVESAERGIAKKQRGGPKNNQTTKKLAIPRKTNAAPSASKTRSGGTVKRDKKSPSNPAPHTAKTLASVSESLETFASKLSEYQQRIINPQPPNSSPDKLLRRIAGRLVQEAGQELTKNSQAFLQIFIDYKSPDGITLTAKDRTALERMTKENNTLTSKLAEFQKTPSSSNHSDLKKCAESLFTYAAIIKFNLDL